MPKPRAAPNQAAAALIAVAMALTACSGSSSGAAPTKTPAPAQRSSAAGGQPGGVRGLVDPEPLAVALFKSIFTTTDLAAAGVPAEDATLGVGPIGPLSLAGVAGNLIPPGENTSPVIAALKTAGAKAGAVRRFHIGPARVTGPILSVLVIDFAGTGSAPTFEAGFEGSAPGSRPTDHPEVHIGILPGKVVRNPTHAPPPAPANLERVFTRALYPDGVLYIVSTQAPQNVIADAQIIGALTVQDKKYQAVKSQLPDR